MSELRSILVVLTALAAAGCAQTAPTPAPAPVARETAARETAKGVQHWISITPFTQVTRYRCSGDTTSCDDVKGNDNYAGAYTRLVIYDSEPGLGAEGSATLPYAQRPWLDRLFFGVHRTVTLTAKVNVGSFAATVPLVTIDHISNKTTGETFNRVIYHEAKNYPLFLVRKDGSNAIVSVQFTVKASDQAQSDAAGPALKLIQYVTNFVAPPASVVTTLTSQNSKNVATALDQSISQLFTTTIDEEQWVDDEMRFWGDRVSVTFRIPKDDGDWTASPDDPIGQWTVSFSYPRPSIFSDYEICPKDTHLPHDRCVATYDEGVQKVRADVTPDQVLSFHLVGNQSNLDTMKKYLLQQDWYQKDVVAMSKSGDIADTVSSFCRSIKGAVADLGLNATDAEIVVWAVPRGLDLDSKVTAAMANDRQNCQ